jgi:polyisoprenoid-binding protein YceI
MKLLNYLNRRIFYFTVFFFSFINVIQSQEYQLNNQNSKFSVSGTSNLHDWEIVVNEHSGVIDVSHSGVLIIHKLKIFLESESLKSGKKGMDKNTYKALNTNEYKNITFLLTETKDIVDLGDEKYKVKANGDLTVSGVTKNVTLDFNLKIKEDTINIIGEKPIKMTDYNIDPPQALFGTITTGDEITIKFNTVLQKQI